MSHPDPSKHRLISFFKSGIRILGCLAAVSVNSVMLLGVFLLAAELIGIVEEMV